MTLYVSSGPEQVAVPDVVGLPQEEAQQTLADAGFESTVTEEGSDEVDPGTVLRQDPAGDIDADPGSTVTLVVAREIPAVELPDLVGLGETEASDTLTAAGLEPRTSLRDVTDPAEEGIVLDQRPAVGTPVPQGAPVRIFVGRLVETPAPPTEPSEEGEFE